MPQSHVDAADLLHQAVATADLEREVGQQRAELEFGRRQIGVNDQLQPQAQLCHVYGPVHHVHPIQVLADNALLALIGSLLVAQVMVGPGYQVIQHIEHADQERAGATSRIQRDQVAQ